MKLVFDLLGIFQQFFQVFFQFGECFGFDCVEFGLNSGFVVEVRECDFFELIDKFVEFTVFCGF